MGRIVLPVSVKHLFTGRERTPFINMTHTGREERGEPATFDLCTAPSHPTSLSLSLSLLHLPSSSPPPPLPHQPPIPSSLSHHVWPPRQSYLWPHYRRWLQLQWCGSLFLQQRLHPRGPFHVPMPGQPPVEPAAANMQRLAPGLELDWVERTRAGYRETTCIGTVQSQIQLRSWWNSKNIMPRFVSILWLYFSDWKLHWCDIFFNIFLFVFWLYR